MRTSKKKTLETVFLLSLSTELEKRAARPSAHLHPPAPTRRGLADHQPEDQLCRPRGQVLLQAKEISFAGGRVRGSGFGNRGRDSGGYIFAVRCSPYSKYPPLFRVACRPSTRKEVCAMENQVFSEKHTLKKAGILSRGGVFFSQSKTCRLSVGPPSRFCSNWGAPLLPNKEQKVCYHVGVSRVPRGFDQMHMV